MARSLVIFERTEIDPIQVPPNLSSLNAIHGGKKLKL